MSTGLTFRQFVQPLRWIDGRPLASIIEPYRWDIFDRAFVRMIEACDADATCSSAFPSLDRDLDPVLERLAADPPEISLSVEGMPHPARLDRGLFMSLLLRAFTPGLLGTVPAVIHAP